MDMLFQWLRPKESRKIRRAVMDMWKEFHDSTLKPEHALETRILVGKFHVMQHTATPRDLREIRRDD